MATTNKNRTLVVNMVYAAVLTALVVILQFMGSFIRLGPFSISLVLIPIVIGAAMCNQWIGAWLGFVFSIVVLISGDAAAFLAINPFGTVLTVIVKGIACGLVSGLVYRLLEKKNAMLAVYVSAAVCPLVNTGLFFVGCLAFFMDTVAEWAVAFGFGDNVAAYMFLGLAGFNFLFELIVNVALSPMIVRVLKMREKKD